MNFNEFQQKIILLSVKQFMGFSHYWGTMIETREDAYIETEVERCMTAAEAEQRNRRENITRDDVFHWQEGSTTSEFDSQEQLFESAIQLFNEKYRSKYQWLMVGQRATYPPYLVLVGPFETKTQLNNLWLEAESMGWWDHKENDTRMDEFEKEFFRIFEEADEIPGPGSV